MAAERAAAPVDELEVLITTEGIATYLACHRAWWLADVLGHAPSMDLLAAQASLSQRRRLAHVLTATGAGMIGLAVLIVVVSLLAG